ncbi:MAG: TRAP transporter small permease [Alphaproteobacteria bacterium]|jgi:TRAP-type C4-dicarboxylate transport system permease small subunit|nr:TRAP transporter small permease [Alphaproteobacteria bacterium]
MWLRHAERALKASQRALGLGTNAALLAIMSAISLDAGLRYVAGQPIAGVLEGVELLLVFVIFASLAQTQVEGGHIAIGFLTERLGGRARAALRAFTTTLALGLFGSMTWATGELAWRSWQMGEYAAGLIAFPIYPSRIMVALGCLFLCLQLAFELATAIARLFGSGENRT